MSQHTDNTKEGAYVLNVDPELEALVPKMQDKEYEGLKESIKRNGQLVPILATQDHIIVDGHHRFRACKELDIAPKYAIRRFKTKDEAKHYVITANLNRRNLNRYQKIELAYKDLAIEAEKASKRSQATLKKGNSSFPLGENQPSGESGRVTDVIARRIGIGPDTVRKGFYLIERAHEEMKQKLRNREISIDRAYRQLVAVKKKAPKAEFEGDIAKISDCVTLIFGNIRNVTENEVATGSLDLIICDKFWTTLDTEFAADYARFADRTLKPNGTLVLLANADKIHEMCWVAGKAAKELKSIFLFRLVCDDTKNSSQERTKNWLVFRKQRGWPTREFFTDLEDFRDRKSEAHDYSEESVMKEYFITRLTAEGGVVCEIGLSPDYTTGDIARKYGRSFQMITDIISEDLQNHFYDLESRFSDGKSASA